ncbi:hypothetical protein ILYODFUR_038193, partial [Ilyodon furcidens]
PNELKRPDWKRPVEDRVYIKKHGVPATTEGCGGRKDRLSSGSEGDYGQNKQ